MERNGGLDVLARLLRLSRIQRIGYVLALALAGLLTVTLALRTLYPRTPADEVLASGRRGSVDLPWRFDGAGKGNRLDVRVPFHWGGPPRWLIIPDDELVALQINGPSVPLDGVPPQSLKDWQHGFEMDLSPWLRRGDNELTFTLDNKGGPGGLTLRPVLGWRVILLAASFVPWLLALALTFRLRRVPTAILCAALLVMAVYWAATSAFVRGYDVKYRGQGGHLDYVVYVAEHWRLPRSDQGWEFYQPPLYYGAGAVALRWADKMGVSELEALQGYSLSLWLLFLVASARALQDALRRSGWWLSLAVGALAFWPSGIMDSVRIGNDLALYAACGVATWFMLRWWRSGRRAHLAAMCVAVAAALLSKSSGAALVATASALLGLRLLTRGRWRRARGWGDALLAGSIVTMGAALSIGRNVWYRLHGELSSWLVGSIGTLDANLRVPNTWRYYVPLDIPVFLSSPWVDTRDDATGRANFWNFLLRSSLTGEFRYDGEWRADVSILWGALLLALLLLLALRVHPIRRPRLTTVWRNMPWILLSVAWLASVLCSRIAFPYSCQGDFRFIVPVLIPFVLACVLRGRLSRLLLLAMTVSSAIFFITL